MEKQKTFSAQGLTRRLMLSFFFLLASTFAFAQTEASGTIVDNEGEPIIGATIMEKGTSNGTISDIDGNFHLKTASGATLVISYIGFETQELPAQAGMNITMSDNAKELTEVLSLVIRCSARPTSQVPSR